jgi:tyrosine-protein phosphatase YwqE
MENIPVSLIERINNLKLPVIVTPQRYKSLEYNSYAITNDVENQILQEIEDAGIVYSDIRILSPGAIQAMNFVETRLNVYFSVDSENNLVVERITWG